MRTLLVTFDYPPMIGGIDCMNGTSHYSSQILPPHSHGSGKSLLTDVLVDKAWGHEERFELSRTERDLILAWMDTNSNYFGTWDYTQHATCNAIMSIRGPLSAAMEQAAPTSPWQPTSAPEIDAFCLYNNPMAPAAREAIAA